MAANIDQRIRLAHELYIVPLCHPKITLTIVVHNTVAALEIKIPSGLVKSLDEIVEAMGMRQPIDRSQIVNPETLQAKLEKAQHVL